MKENRNSNIELLRIICMIFIIFHHYSFHGGYSAFNTENFNVNIFYIQEISMLGKVACSIFAIITGYFMINKNINLKISIKKIFKLFVIYAFYNILIILIVKSFNIDNVNFKQIFKSFLSMKDGNWYFITYFIILLIAPFLNKIIKSFEERDYKIFLIILYIIWSLIPTLINDEWDFSNIDFFIIMYMTGAYIRLYVNNINMKKNKIVLFSSLFLLFSSVLFFDYIGMKLKLDIFIKNATYFRKMNSILTVLVAISMFNCFFNFNIKSKLINFISQTTMGIYLIHDNIIMRHIIWQKISPNTAYMNSPYLHSLIKVSITFILCMIIELFRIYVLEKIIINIHKNYKKVKEKYNEEYKRN